MNRIETVFFDMGGTLETLAYGGVVIGILTHGQVSLYRGRDAVASALNLHG